MNEVRLSESPGPERDSRRPQKREEARRLLRDGIDPMAERKAIKAQAEVAKANTFGVVADELLAKLEREKKAAVTVEKRRWLLKELAAPLAGRPIS